MEKNKLYWFVLLLSLAGLIWIIVHRIGVTWIPAGCVWHKVTGIPCPACGSTRAAVTFLQGHYLDGFLINPFGIFTVFLAVLLPVWVCIDLILKRESFYMAFRKTESLLRKKAIASFFIFLVIANWLWNISKNL